MPQPRSGTTRLFDGELRQALRTSWAARGRRAALLEWAAARRSPPVWAIGSLRLTTMRARRKFCRHE